MAATSLLLLVLAAVAGADRLIQVQILTRHGSRAPLTKSAEDLSEGGSSGLTPLGERQLYDLGNWLRGRYASQTQGYPLYDPPHVRFQSSSFDRTIISAQSLALGLFPSPQRSSNMTGESLLPQNVTRANIPVYTHDRNNDIEIRAYENCPAFHKSLAELYESPLFKRMEQSHMALLIKLSQEPTFAGFTKVENEQKYLPLNQIWNAFDAIHVARTECEPNADTVVCKSLPDPNIRNFLNQDEWNQLSELAHKVELLKYGPDIAGTKLGSNLIFTIINAMKSAYQSGNSRPSWIVYSGHYPTILGVFSALNIRKSNEILERVSIPNYASALIFELWRTSDDDTKVRLLYKEGLGDNVTVLNFGKVCQYKEECPMFSLEKELKNSIKESDASIWCAVCENISANACILGSENTKCSKDGIFDSSAAVVLLTLFSLLVGVFLGIFGNLLMKKYRNKGDARRLGDQESVIEEQKMGEIGS